MPIAALVLIAANLLPVVGVLYWGWDAFVLLMLYWMETAIIGFWTIVRVAAAPDDSGMPRGIGAVLSGFGRAAFFTVHAGIFMLVHFVFLWTLFSDGWSRRIHGVGDFFSLMVVGTGLWFPVIILLLGRGWALLWPVVAPRLGFAARPMQGEAEGGVIAALYTRIIVMQFTILIGAWFAILAGNSAGALILLIVIKTVVDLGIVPVAAHFRVGARKPASGPARD